jgi:hypothetical protein
MEHWWNDSDGGKLKYWEKSCANAYFPTQMQTLTTRQQTEASSQLSAQNLASVIEIFQFKERHLDYGSPQILRSSPVSMIAPLLHMHTVFM